MESPRNLKCPWYVPRHSAYTLLAFCLLIVGVVPILIAVGLDIKNPGIWGITHVMVTAGLAFILGVKNQKAAILVLMLFLPWQPLLSMPIATSIGSTGTRMLVMTKDIYIAVLLPTLFLKNSHKVRLNVVDIAASVFVFVYALYTIISPAGLTAIATSFREGFMVAAFYLVGRLSMFNLDDIIWFLGIAIIIAIIVASFGYIERFLFSEEIWTKIGAGEYISAKSGREIKGRYNTEGLVPRNWFTYVKDTLYRRMVSSIGDPTSLSRYLSLPILALFFLPTLFNVKIPRSLRILMLLFLSGAVILTFGRGGLLIVLGGVAIWIYDKYRIFSLLMVPMMILILLATPVFDMDSGSSPVHVKRAAAGLQEIITNPFGQGVGTAGTKALRYSEEAVEGTGESYLLGLSFQTGFLGPITYTFFFLSMVKQFINIYKRTRRNSDLVTTKRMALLGLTLAGGIYLTSLFANSAIAPISAGLSLFYCGALIGYFTWRSQPEIPHKNKFILFPLS